MDYYRVLGINKNATLEEIKNAYWDLARKYHPDFNQDKNASYLFMQLKQAYDILSDYKYRSDYDSRMGFTQDYSYYSDEKSESNEVPQKDNNPNESNGQNFCNKSIYGEKSFIKKHYIKFIIISLTINMLLFAFVFVIDKKPIEANAIMLNHTNIDMEIYESFDLIVTIEPHDASIEELIWKSSNPHIVHVSSTGILIAVDLGTAIITVHETEADLKAECKVTVSCSTINDYETSVGVYSGTISKYSPPQNKDKYGYGILIIHNGNRYSPHGYGTMVFNDGSEYVGDWKDGLMHGQGTMTYPNWSIHEGSFVNNVLNGKGAYISPDGKKFLFEFRDGFPVDEGIVIMPDGETYKAIYKDDYFHWQR